MNDEIFKITLYNNEMFSAFHLLVKGKIEYLGIVDYPFHDKNGCKCNVDLRFVFKEKKDDHSLVRIDSSAGVIVDDIPISLGEYEIKPEEYEVDPQDVQFYYKENDFLYTTIGDYDITSKVVEFINEGVFTNNYMILSCNGNKIETLKTVENSSFRSFYFAKFKNIDKDFLIEFNGNETLHFMEVISIEGVGKDNPQGISMVTILASILWIIVALLLTIFLR